jgi:glycylpeptide N-tetradecanoyltransferase
MLFAVYAYYYVPGSLPLATLMEDALILARGKGVDVFNCLDLMENAAVLERLKFGQGDGNLQYYLYNWGCPSLAPAQVGLVLL